MKHNIRQRQLDANGLMTTKIVKVEGELGSGRFDKNGKEIFEGDLVRDCDDVISTVVFENGQFLFNDEDEVVGDWDYTLEVVGHAED